MHFRPSDVDALNAETLFLPFDVKDLAKARTTSSPQNFAGWSTNFN
jgi:uncharacterized membrane protein (DUF2068 family)